MCDFGGLDIWRTSFENLAPDIRSNIEVPEVINRIVEAGRHGVKSGHGILEYDSVEDTIAERDMKMLKLLKLVRTDTEEES